MKLDLHACIENSVDSSFQIDNLSKPMYSKIKNVKIWRLL